MVRSIELEKFLRDRNGKPLQTVWILGAGFSRSLGGPLLADLFRQEDLGDLNARYPAIEYGDLADSCWRTEGLFNWGRAVERQWSDAEQFIDFVDCAAKGSPEEASLLRMSRMAQPYDRKQGPAVSHHDMRFPDLTSIQFGVLRALAAECSHFLKGALVRTERWAPYRQWLAGQSGEFHTVVSFNYDAVLETLSKESNTWVPLPDEITGSANRVLALKLHGSVTWLREGSSCTRVRISEALASPGQRIALGIPGQTKRTMKDELLEPLWQAAENAIRAADVIVFLGYRFPATDGDARRRVLGAIAENRSTHLRIHVALGPNIQHPDAVRVLRLIEVCTRMNRTSLGSRPRGLDTVKGGQTLKLTAEPLFAEDFLALYGGNGPLSKYA
jgi:hypothetical protein